MVGNLLGHFEEVDVAMAPVAQYAEHQLEGCDRALYMGTYHDAKMPHAFLADVAKYQRPFFWMNYNIWKLERELGAARFKAAWGFSYVKIDGDFDIIRGRIPNFYRTFTYKGATFTKLAYLDEHGVFNGHAEIVLVRNVSATVLAEGMHSATKGRTPYLLRKGHLFYIADDPVDEIDVRDRYLIFCDVLFDFLELPPRSEKRYALVRLEDVHPAYDLKLLYETVDVLRQRKVPFAITLIPRYVGPDRKGLSATANPRFLEAIRYAIAHGASILVHGYEHQVNADLGCGLSFTGEGYEFWDSCNGRPLPFDSAKFVQSRIDRAKKILSDAKLPFAGWVTPHYAASPLALRLIQREFGRFVQRVTYFPKGRPPSAENAIDQFFPYTIRRDYYGLFVWPENLGYLPLDSNPDAVDQMLQNARLNKVVRDGWASFFWHPFLIRGPLGIASLEKLVDGIRAEGFEFVSLKELRARGE